METFGQHLLQFANSIDIVSESVLGEARDMITDYLKKSLNIQFMEILVPIKINNQGNGLKSEWSPGGKEWVQTLKDAEGKYNGQISYAWEKQRPIMWIVSASGTEDLVDSDSFKDILYPNDKDIPKYVDLTDHHIKTSIISMLPLEGTNIGILNLESTKYLKPSRVLKKEIENISISIGLLMGLYNTYKIQNATTGKAIDALGEYKNLHLSVDLKAFFAFSQKADNNVIEAINEAIQSYDIELQDWQKDFNPGNITEQIWENILNSEIGISYLSEPTRSGARFRYEDNYNVVFETGMMHCLTKIKKMQKYVLIRETVSPNTPFNFTTENILYVPRDESGKLKKDDFIVNLKRAFDRLRIPNRVK